METPAKRWMSVANIWVRLACPMCAVRSDIAAHHVRLYRCTTREKANFYSWVCPSCEEPVSRPADVSSECLLLGASVPVTLFSWPEEIGDSERSFGPWTRYDEADFLLDVEALPTAGEDAA